MASDDNGAVQSLRADDLVFDLPRCRVLRRGEVLKISGLTLAFLRTLMERSPRAVSYDELSDRLSTTSAAVGRCAPFHGPECSRPTIPFSVTAWRSS